MKKYILLLLFVAFDFALAFSQNTLNAVLKDSISKFKLTPQEFTQSVNLIKKEGIKENLGIVFLVAHDEFKGLNILFY